MLVTLHYEILSSLYGNGDPFVHQFRTISKLITSTGGTFSKLVLDLDQHLDCTTGKWSTYMCKQNINQTDFETFTIIIPKLLAYCIILG